MYYDRITEFVFQQDALQRTEYLVIPGSGYGELAKRAAQLYQEGYARRIIVSGKHSILQETFSGPISPEEYIDRTFDTESDFLKEVLLENGVRETDILKEPLAEFTYENAVYTRLFLEHTGRKIPKKMTAVCQAFHGARVKMYFEKVFPETEIRIEPVNTQNITKENWFSHEHGVQIVLGEMERMGTQFMDLLNGKDQTANKCKEKAAAFWKLQQLK